MTFHPFPFNPTSTFKHDKDEKLYIINDETTPSKSGYKLIFLSVYSLLQKFFVLRISTYICTQKYLTKWNE